MARAPAAPRRRRRRLRPGTWPVRWRLAAASAGLTLAILLVFGAVIGNLAAERVRSDFNRELAGRRPTLAAESGSTRHRVRARSSPGLHLKDFASPNGAIGPDLQRPAASSSTTARRRSTSGRRFAASTTSARCGSPPPRIYSGASGSSPATSSTAAARSTSTRRSTALWLLIAAGVLGGTLLASLAGLAIAGRAMRPIASLTATARQIAATRDPSRKMPEPTADDEVGELARTLEQMLRSLDAARAEREGAMQKQREFVADASHELRTPLTSVLANLELLQASLQAPGQAEDREMVDSALRSSRRMSRLVADLLLLARADAGRIGERRRCDLAEIAGNAAAEVAPVMGERELSVDNGRPIFVEGNPDELHRMVVNLLDNAAHHTPAGLTHRAAPARRGRRRRARGRRRRPGHPAELRDQVFDRFVRGDGPADVAAGPGPASAWPSSRAVATSHGGTVEATESAAGRRALPGSPPAAAL